MSLQTRLRSVQPRKAEQTGCRQRSMGFFVILMSWVRVSDPERYARAKPATMAFSARR